MYNNLKNLFIKNLKENLFIYFFVFFCLLIGISIGAFTIKVVDLHQKQELISYLKGFFRLLDETGLRSMDIFKESIFNNIQLLVLSWLMGLVIIGIPIVLLVVVFKGFVIGFTVGLIIDEFKFYGVLLFILGIFPQNLLLVPAFIIAAVTSIVFGITVIKAKIKKNKTFKLSKLIFTYTSIYLVILLMVIMGSLIESFIVPSFIKLIANYIGV
ncbi:stage II sporulation protein M [Alkaliphilus serpentinus]|uniref:Stage II sporulation protein M n=1 Tax=Alkaliphilus serpentinus TaxID=1482731 RepID=A0A833HMD5_9FIRM|nr:stage II sporulation protein M [Alkaliphilus serpentinus]KAB3527375.1 stage II sporulation protein M [Alkaliphilus serpentinus]